MEPLGEAVPSRGTSKSAVSRRFVARTQAQLETWQAAPLEDLDLVGRLLDGVHVGEHCLIVALGVAADGCKHALGIWEGSTETAAVCPVQGSCGGCDLMTLDYPAQVSAKVGILRDALTRIGRFEALPELEFVAADQPLAYRSRIRLHVTKDGRLGFFAAESRELVEIPGCPVAHPELEQALRTLRSIAGQHRAELASFSEVELRVAPAGPRLALRLLPAARRFDDTTPLVAALSEVFRVSIGERSPAPEHDQRYPLPGGVELRVSGAAFTQVNWAVNQRLVQALIDGAAQRKVSTFCDLYCGAGNFSLPLLAIGMSGVGIEGSKPAIAAAKRASAEQPRSIARVRPAGDTRPAPVSSLRRLRRPS